MKNNTHQDESGATYEEVEGERETGDCEGDKKFVLGDCLTPDQIAELFPDKNTR